MTYWGHKLGTNIERDIRNELYEHIQKMNFGFFDNQKSGKIIGRLTNDLMDIGEVAHQGPERWVCSCDDACGFICHYVDGSM